MNIKGKVHAPDMAMAIGSHIERQSGQTSRPLGLVLQTTLYDLQVTCRRRGVACAGCGQSKRCGETSDPAATAAVTQRFESRIEMDEW